jgi:hypothetical protein
MEACVLGFVDDSRPTAAQLFENPIVGDSAPEERVGERPNSAILGCAPEASQRTYELRI